MNRFYVTTPIYYVNDVPHIGHAYTTVLADVLARLHRLFGIPTWFLTGTDEHGQKVQQAARAAGIEPREQADRTVVRFQELWRKLQITHDDFIRTTEVRHVRAVRAVLQDLYDRGEIYQAEYDGWYDVSSETFVTERDLGLAEGEEPIGRPNIIRVRETNYFFRMSRYQEWLVEYIESHPDFIRPDFRRNETLGFLRTRPLGDLCISRPKNRLSWGIELPFDPNYVCYVWFDALLNYITAIGYPHDPATFAKWWPASLQLIGKDILTTHTVYWPTMLKALGLPLPRTVFAHGWWLMGNTKMSKSLGNVVNPMEMIERHGADAFRYFLISEMVLGQDASFSEEAFERRYNSDLANDLGNLVSRLVTMLNRYHHGRWPAPAGVPTDGPELVVWQASQDAVAGMERALTTYELDRAVAGAITAIRAINRYLEQRAPWNLARHSHERERLHTTLYTAGECLRVATSLLHPVMPGRIADLRRAFGLSETPAPEELRQWGGLPVDAPVQLAGPLFPRIEDRDHGQVSAATGPSDSARPTSAPAAQGGLVSIEEFSKIQLRTACVVAAEPVPGTNKLLKLEIDLGSERRTIVAGIAQHYQPADLIGRTIVVVANLAPANIRGVESHGMLLAASSGGSLRLLTVDGDLPPGSPVR
jgi:methionyl-tRNA synthetase